MTDREALAVTYRVDRGEPRGPHKKGQPWEGRGACIDCNQCVAACPMGIDIREGPQLECINCGLCIDACDDVMARVNLASGLIAYDTDANVKRRLRGEKSRFRFVRPRTVFYAAVLLVVGSVMLFGLTTRKSIDLDVLRDRNPNFVTLSDGAVRNGYTLKLMNRSDSPRDFLLNVGGPVLEHVNVIGLGNISMPAKLTVEADKVRTVRVIVTVARHDLHRGEQEILFQLGDTAKHEMRTVDTVFVSGEQ
jgi:cytochrome c oxidase accessory protein FixG